MWTTLSVLFIILFINLEYVGGIERSVKFEEENEVDSRQSNYYGYQRPYPSNKYQATRYPSSFYGQRPQDYYYPQQRPPLNIRDRYSLMQVLTSVARYDDLQCVPRLICEMIADANIGIKTQLPFNVDMTSLIGLLSVVNGLNTSPLIYFSKAALLGITSQNNKYSCYTAYPHCPSDPDKLVQYLNNHNGGFFRFFNGLPQQQGFYKNAKAESRIQTQPVKYVNQNFIRLENVPDYKYYTNYNQFSDQPFKFPGAKRGGKALDQHQNSFIFPKEEPELNNNPGVQFPHLDINRIKFLPYSDRTGTGDLKLDVDDFY